MAVGSLVRELSPDARAARVLVGWCKLLEQDAGRILDRPVSGSRNAPRTLDVDLLLLGPLQIDLPAKAETSPSDQTQWPGEIRVPHPRLRHRRFVLRPLCDLVPDLVLPGDDRAPARRALAELDAELEYAGAAAEEQRVEVWRDNRSGEITGLPR